MRYSHICQYVTGTPWAILPEKMDEILSVLAFRVNGGEFTAEEINARIGSGSAKAKAAKQGAVAVIPVYGTIAHRMSLLGESSGGASTETISAMVQQVAADDSVGTIVLDVDSPGGTIPGVSELAAEIRAARQNKRIVAVSNSLMASAAYWIASQADEIVSIPSGTVGSIGVFTAHQDLSKKLEQDGINVTLISAGKYKVEGNPFEPLSDEAKAVLQARVDDAYTSFVQDVAKGRNVTAKDVREGYGQGRALAAKDALSAGLIDRIETMDQTLSRLTGANDSERRRRMERF